MLAFPGTGFACYCARRDRQSDRVPARKTSVTTAQAPRFERVTDAQVFDREKVRTLAVRPAAGRTGFLATFKPARRTQNRTGN
jgi:hypothetical protein